MAQCCVKQWAWGQLRARWGLLLGLFPSSHVFSLSLLPCVTRQALAIPKAGLGNEIVLGLASGEWWNSCLAGSAGVLAMPLLASPECGTFLAVSGLGWPCVCEGAPGPTP